MYKNGYKWPRSVFKHTLLGVKSSATYPSTSPETEEITGVKVAVCIVLLEIHISALFARRLAEDEIHIIGNISS
jgi:hypothetical protein